MKKISKQFFIFPPVMVMSMYFTALGFLTPIIKEKFLLSSAQVGLFSTMQSVGTLVSLVICFCVVSAMNKSRIFLITTFLFAVCLVLLALGSEIMLLYMLFVLIGLFSGIASTLSNTILVEGGSKDPGYYIGILHGVWAGMAALGPFFVLLFSDDYQKTLVWLGVLITAMLLVFAFGLRERLRMPSWEDKTKVNSLYKLLKTFTYKGMVVLLLIGFFTTIIRSGFSFFMRSYIEFLGREPIFGAYLLGVFFIGMFVGRMVYGRISSKVNPSKVLFFTNITALAAYITMILTDNVIAFIVLMSIGALCIASNVPIMITKAYSIMPKDTTAATSFVFLSLVTGSLLGPPIIGWLGDVANMRIAMLCCISVLVPIIVFAWNMLQKDRLAKPITKKV